MRTSRNIVVHRLDLLIVFALLATVLLVPISFMLPFNDEWLRVNYLADKSAWQWTVMHTQAWVVRPTAELIMALASLPYTRPALGDDFTPAAFLTRFHRVYVVLALSFCALLYAQAAIVTGRWRAREALTLSALFALTCWLMADEIGYGFYWTDGWANVLMPFVMLVSGLALVARAATPGAFAGGAALIVLGALGHEVLCIYAIGVLGLLSFRSRPAEQSRGVWRHWGARAGLCLACLAILAAQLFSEGPRNRSANYLHSTGVSYDFASAWLNVRTISPWRSLLSVLTPIAAVAIYRDHLAGVPERAASDARAHRVCWVLLALGTLLVCFLPLTSVGLKKGRLAIASYSVLTQLLFVLLGVVLCPLADRISERLLRGYRRRVGSVLPLLLVLIPASGNLSSFRDAVTRNAELREQAYGYMEKLFSGQKRVQLCRPDHPYVKPARMLTDHNEAIYFGLEKVRHRCPKP